MPRSTHAEAILGKDFTRRLGECRVLVVGAGGIGCELLKNIVLTGFGHITLLDLDTIDLSNLNRQFLFRKKDVKQSKALIAAKTAAQFNPSVHIYPIHANIKESQYDVDWFSKFDIVLNALDNLEARRHVNKMCLAANVPLVESGTAGYLGQVQPLLKNHTECFDCMAKPTPKTFPVCTIRSTPSQPIHCIVWAKSYLIPQLFGEEEEDETDLDNALSAGENAAEIDSLRKQARAFKTIRQALRDPATPTEEIAKKSFQKVFNEDIKTLLSMKDMWKSRKPPTALDWDSIQEDSQDPPYKVNGLPNGTSSPASGAPTLRDQKQLSLLDCVELFGASASRIAIRLRSGEDNISFDKDDPDTLDFVTASANLRAFAYGIQTKTKWEVKEMAGNIIPAIATTNAIIAGAIVLQALHLLRRAYSIPPRAAAQKLSLSPTKKPAQDPITKILRNVNIQTKPTVPLAATRVSPPNVNCSVCQDTYTVARCDVQSATLRELVEGAMGDGEEVLPGVKKGGKGGTGLRDVSVFEGNRLLADPDFDDNMDKTLSEIGVERGSFVTLVDEDGDYGNLSLAIAALPPNDPSGSSLILASPLPIPPKKQKPTLKRPRSPSPDIEPVAVTTAKRARVNGAPVPASANGVAGGGSGKKRGNDDGLLRSPSKRQRLEEDGVVIMENDDDVIVIED